MNANDTAKTSRTDWKELETMPDDEIDYSDIPPLSDSFFERAKRFVPANTVELDPDVLAWFKAHGKEYQTLVNMVLRKYMEVQQQFEHLSGQHAS